MKHLLECGVKLVDSQVNEKTEQPWTLKRKLFLGID